MRTITIEVNEIGFTVREGDRYCDGLCWDEMIGTIMELSHPKLGSCTYRMLTADEWAEYRRKLLQPPNFEEPSA